MNIKAFFGAGGPLALLLVFIPIVAAAGTTSAEPTSPPGLVVARPPIITAAEWGSVPEPISPERVHTPVRITLHHGGVYYDPASDPYKKIRALQRWGQRAKGWPDLPYHFLIAPDGRIFEGRSLKYAGETNTAYDTTGHALICVWGNFEVQRINREQLRSVVDLCAWLCQEYGIDPMTIRGHKDWAQTACPGRDFYRYIADGTIERWVRERLAGKVPRIQLKPPAAPE